MRAVAASVLLAVIVALCIYSGTRPPELSLDDCLREPSSHDGAVVFTPREARLGKVMDGGFTVRWGGREITVRGDPPDAPPGTYIQVKGRFHAEGYLDEIAARTGRYREIKIAVSAVAVLIVVWLLGRDLRWDGGERAFRVKERKGGKG